MPFHIEAFCISTGRPSRSTVQVPFQNDADARPQPGGVLRLGRPAAEQLALPLGEDPLAVADDGRRRLLPVGGAQHGDDGVPSRSTGSSPRG